MNLVITDSKRARWQAARCLPYSLIPVKQTDRTCGEFDSHLSDHFQTTNQHAI
jgi:hypothetical protein